MPEFGGGCFANQDHAGRRQSLDRNATRAGNVIGHRHRAECRAYAGGVQAILYREWDPAKGTTRLALFPLGGSDVGLLSGRYVAIGNECIDRGFVDANALKNRIDDIARSERARCVAVEEPR